jgi:hypothetical protein
MLLDPKLDQLNAVHIPYLFRAHIIIPIVTTKSPEWFFLSFFELKLLYISHVSYACYMSYDPVRNF